MTSEDRIKNPTKNLTGFLLVRRFAFLWTSTPGPVFLPVAFFSGFCFFLSCNLCAFLQAPSLKCKFTNWFDLHVGWMNFELKEQFSILGFLVGENKNIDTNF